MSDITKEEFLEYRKIQDSGMFNMYDPSARACTSLDKGTWIQIMTDYSELAELYPRDTTDE